MKLTSEQNRNLQEWYGSGELDARSAVALELPPQAFKDFLASHRVPEDTVTAFLADLKTRTDRASLSVIQHRPPAATLQAATQQLQQLA
ncbi:MAG: hypothetical protein PW734_00960 [Verrucomicrobium sp.]|nr:hypothetical protein [Verrucomicrobium sp.]